MEWSPEDSLVNFSKVERLAVSVLLGLILLGGTTGYWLPVLWPKAEIDIEARTAFQQEIAAWEVRNQRLVDSLAQVKEAREQRYAANQAKWDKPSWNKSPSKRESCAKRKEETASIDYSIPYPELGSVDANTVDTSILFRMGVPPKIARRWVKFRDRGGSFVRKEDVGKLYGMPDSTLTRIIPLLKVPDLKKKRQPFKKVTREPVMVNVNLASSEELQQVRGIGAFYADKIIEYCQKLGGFLTLNQVAETPGLRAGAFDELRKELTITTQEPRLIRINQVSDWKLAQHPYISKKQAEIIVLNRRNRGKFKGRADLLATIVLDTTTVDRLLPYIDFGE